MCFPVRRTHITKDMCLLSKGTHITRDMCFLGRGTHITRDMCFPGRRTHITRYMGFLGRQTTVTITSRASDRVRQKMGNSATFSREIMRQERSIMRQIMRFF